MQFSCTDVPLAASPTQLPSVLPLPSSPSPTTLIPPLSFILTDSIHVSSQVSDTSAPEPAPYQDHIQNPPSQPATIPPPSTIPSPSTNLSPSIILKTSSISTTPLTSLLDFFNIF